VAEASDESERVARKAVTARLNILLKKKRSVGVVSE
jgi:hypothetical protein